MMRLIWSPPFRRPGVALLCIAVAALAAGSAAQTSAATRTASSPGVCTAASKNFPLDKRQELVVRLSTQDMSTLDPAQMTTVGSWWVGQQIYSQLVSEPTGIADLAHLKPDLATSWTISPNGLVYTFNLRTNARWQGGYGAVTASDVKFSFDRIKDPATGSAYQAQFAPITTVVINPHKVQLRLTQPYPSLLTDILPSRPGFIVSQKAITALGATTYFAHPYGSGPFQFSSWTPNADVNLTANDAYYMGPPKISGIDMKVIADEGATAIALQSGAIEGAVFTTPGPFYSINRLPNIRVNGIGSIAGYYMDFNTQVAPMNNVLVRRALWYATNQSLISSQVFQGLAAPLYTILPPTLWSWTKNVPMYPYNVAMAKTLLAQAGYPNGFSLSVLYSAGGAPEALALAVQSMWAAVGVNLNLIGLTHAQYNTEEATDRNKYDMVLVHFGRSTDPDSFLTGAYISGSFPPGNNLSYYTGSDQLINQARTEPDPTKRKALYQEVQKQLQIAAPSIPLVHDTFTMAFRSNVCGWGVSANTVFTAYPVWIPPS